jgi:hypothetical protein
MRSVSSENCRTGSLAPLRIITPSTQWPPSSLVIDNANRQASPPLHASVTSSAASTRNITRPVGHSRGSSNSSTDDFR